MVWQGKVRFIITGKVWCGVERSGMVRSGKLRQGVMIKVWSDAVGYAGVW